VTAPERSDSKDAGPETLENPDSEKLGVEHLSPNVRGLAASPTVAINEHCDRLRMEGRVVYKLGLGQSPFPVPGPVVEALQANAHRKEYLAVGGLRALCEVVADYHRRTAGVPFSADNVLIGPGSKELMFLLQVAFDGQVLIPTPAWVSYQPQAVIVGRPARFLMTRREDDWRLSPEMLDDACKEFSPRVLVLNSPSNPTGRSLSKSELEQIAKVARKRQLIVLSDEIYGETHHTGGHATIARYYPEGTIISSGLSKWCGAGGWRLGTFAFPTALRWLQNAMMAVASETYTTTSAPIQYAAVRAFQGGLDIERYLWSTRRILKALSARLLTRMRAADLHACTPDGAFYLFPDFSAHAESLAARGITTSKQLCERLLEERGVAILPGSAFGRPATELTARLAYVDFDGARALAAADALPRDAPLNDEFLAVQCRPVVNAIDKLCDWLENGDKS